MSTEQSSKAFWNKAAADNPYYYVSSYGSYDATRNMEDFWASGRATWSDIKRVTGYSPVHDHVVIEIGCGVGRLTRVIAPEVGRVVALDISDGMLEIARRANFPNVDFRVASGFTLDTVPDLSANLALGYCVFQHLPSTAALASYVREMHRVLKPGGTMAFTLVPRDWKARLLPALRMRAYLRQLVSSNGPKGIYRKEWVGIRPTPAFVRRVSPMRLDTHVMGGDRILYFGRR